MFERWLTTLDPTTAFAADADGLVRAVEALAEPRSSGPHAPLPTELPDTGVGPTLALDRLRGPALEEGRALDAPGFFAHMDPPTPWVSWGATLWTASMNQNLLHPDTAPTARELERLAVSWLAPFFGMAGGHLTAGSTVANLTALWAARELGATEVVAGPAAHLSIRKAARILDLPLRVVDWSEPGDLSGAVAVLTAGTTSTGEIEPLVAAPSARWRHVDAAWAGPLRLSERHRSLLDGVEAADSVAVSAHKWLFQPKESALVLFADPDEAHAAVSVDADYLAVPNVGVLGSHGAAAVALLATLLAYGRQGIATWVDHCMGLADRLHELVEAHHDLEARSAPQTGVLCWRHHRVGAERIRAGLPDDVLVSTTTVDGTTWLRSVAANPMAEPERVVAGVLDAAGRSESAPT